MTTQFRRGLPRLPGGEPWPIITGTQLQQSSQAEPVPEGTAETATRALEISHLRRGLPRVDSGAPWPPDPQPRPPLIPSQTVPIKDPKRSETPPNPLPGPKTPTPAKSRFRMLIQIASVLSVVVIGSLGAIVIARQVVDTSFGSEFLTRYPGYTPMDTDIEPGFPLWLRWNHFLNFFFMMLVIQSGIRIRYQKKTPAFWTNRGGEKKVNLTVWFHTAVDLLWLLNGITYVTLLVWSGHWKRLVPVSLEIFPNAASVLLQYLSLSSPDESNWVAYNSLQQLMYFVMIFVLAPLAAVTGIRLSIWWPDRWQRVNRVYTLAVARAIHYPTMVMFASFIIVHVTLVFASGALHNLNRMYAGVDDDSWNGLLWFLAGLVLTVLAVGLSRPVIIAPLARVFGQVSSR